MTPEQAQAVDDLLRLMAQWIVDDYLRGSDDQKPQEAPAAIDLLLL